MSSYEHLSAIFDRIANGEETAEDIQTMRSLLRSRDDRNVVQVGNNIVNIAEGQDIQIGDRIYGADAEAIKEALRLVLQEKQKAQRPRNEKLLLQAVKEEVVSRLKQSLHNAILINLGKEAQPEQVKRPWSPDIKIGDKPSEQIPDNRTILEIFDQEEIAGKLLILGNPGAGKTTTMLDLAKALIARAEQEADYPIPVLFNLSNRKDDKQSMSDWLVAELKSKYGVRKDIGAKWVSDAKLLPMLDGVDELESLYQEPCVQKINEFMQSDRRPQYLLVCSRWEEYKNYELKLQQINGAICLQELNSSQIWDYLTAVGQTKLWQMLQEDSMLLNLMQKPLFLSIAVLSVQELLIEDWQRLESTKSRIEHLFNAYWRQQMFQRPNKIDIYTTRIKLRYLLDKHFLFLPVELNDNQYINFLKPPSKKQTRHWLVYLAQQLQRESKAEFAIDKMQPSYINNSAAKFLWRIVSGLVFGVIFGVSLGGIVTLCFNPKVGLISGLLTGLSWGITYTKIEKIEPVDKLIWLS
jgi:predicted NACHT family NTPase